MNIIFFGSDDFAKAHLERLGHSAHKIVACVTPPDKEKGRGLKLTVSPIKDYALENQIPILQPVTLKAPDVINKLKSFNPDLFVVIAYGKILPPEVLAIPYICAMNVHGSLLPKYRGAAPINWAILNGEEETGLSIIKMSSTMDAGDIFSQVKISIEEKETALSLRVKMMAQGPDFLVKTIQSIEENNYTLTVQNSKDVTLAPKLTKELGKIDWEKSALQIDRLVRGLYPWPSAYTFYKGKMLKILKAEVASSYQSSVPGQVLDIQHDSIGVSCAQGGLLIKKVHLDSAKPMAMDDFLSGHQLKVGDKLG